MNSMLTTLVPAILPTAISPLPSSAAVTPTASSGRLVPIDTTVSPTSMGLIPSLDAGCAPPRTITSAPIARATRPTTNQPTLLAISV